MSTLREIEKLDELSAKATQGDWHNESKNYGYTPRDICGPCHADGADYAPICWASTNENADFIVACVNYIRQSINQPLAADPVRAALVEALQVAKQTVDDWAVGPDGRVHVHKDVISKAVEAALKLAEGKE